MFRETEMLKAIILPVSKSVKDKMQSRRKEVDGFL